jgi:hypothetical protein
MTNDWAGFFFVGSVVVPGILAFVAVPELAILAFVFLVFLGGLAGIADPGSPCRTRKGSGGLKDGDGEPG